MPAENEVFGTSFGGTISQEPDYRPTLTKTLAELPTAIETVTRPLTEDELTEYRKRYAEVGIEAGGELQRFKGEKETHSLKMKGFSLESKTLIKLIEDKKITQPRTVYKQLNRNNNTVTLIDTETGEILITRDLTAAERQTAFGF